MRNDTASRSRCFARPCRICRIPSIPHLTRRPGPHYTARPGSRVPMFTSRCITPRACASAHPDRAVRQAIIGDAICVFRVHDFPRTRGAQRSRRNPDGHMMQRTLTRIDSPRFTGTYRYAASWCAPVGAFGGGAGVHALAIGLDDSKRRAHELWSIQRAWQAIGQESKSGRTSMSGNRPLDRDGSGAGSRWSAGAP
jgi:hypothetical protein